MQNQKPIDWSKYEDGHIIATPASAPANERASANQQLASAAPITSYADHELEVMRKYANPFVSFTQDEIEAEIARRWTLVTGFRR